MCREGGDGRAAAADVPRQAPAAHVLGLEGAVAVAARDRLDGRDGLAHA